MTRYLTIGLIALAALAAGCGGSDDDEPQAGGAAVGGGGGETLAVQDGVLVDSGGAAVYFADQEANGEIKCVEDCLSFWQPVVAPESGEPTAGDGVTGTLDVIARDDGTRQVTYDGKPLYRFSEDSPGEVTGDGFEDDFGGTTFSWHAITVGEADTESSSGGGGAYDYGP
jgi:predicted lipoprotein with Yx(FWY)xxD motif